MHTLITWPTYGNWFAGYGRGCLDLDPASIGQTLPEPTLCGETAGQPSSPWPAVRLAEKQRRVVLADLPRVASLRAFIVDRAVVAPTFVHLLIELDHQRDLRRLVQLVKGALSRALTVAAGDRLPFDATGAPLPHHKWWSRQYACLRITDDALRRCIAGALERRAAHRDCCA